ncbi:hypothetical protein Y032_0009g496 [Ancylostoma ceylanicum]|uniref:Uncharacterized protein n=1 Tax=Ancylostoma ceylanicum TaxID=53326 RepID=A0A016VK01_9BILA|nr:hypothetical protein Y032_0009g496 [Ancylostoma ceylanicum]
MKKRELEHLSFTHLHHKGDCACQRRRRHKISLSAFCDTVVSPPDGDPDIRPITMKEIKVQMCFIPL